MKRRYNFSLCVLCLLCFESRSQTVLDSVDISYLNYNIQNFGYLNPTTPIVQVPVGLYMPKDNIWFFKPNDTASRISQFALSSYDTSIYLVLKNRRSAALVNLSKNAMGDEVEQRIMELPMKARYLIQPMEKSMFMFASLDSTLTIYQGYKSKVNKVLERKGAVNCFIIDTNAILINYGNRIGYYKSGLERELFNSPLPIQHIAFSPSGLIIIATRAGIFKVKKDLSAALVYQHIPDGILHFIEEHLFVLSNYTKKIYELKYE